MISWLKQFGQVINIGFVTAWLGILTGLLFSYVIPENKVKIKGILMGFVGGLMLAIITLDIIPESVALSNSYLSALGIITGLLLSVYIDGYTAKRHRRSSAFKRNSYLQAAILMAIAIGLDNLPGGVALGSMYTLSHPKGFEMATVLMIHGIPEGLSLGLFLRESDIRTFMLISITIFTSLPMAAGSLIGGIISEVSSSIVSVCLSFACGMMLYITFREIIPKTRELWSGRLSSVGSVIGLVTGAMIMIALH